MSATEVTVRPRTDDDLPVLEALLGEQQPTSSYPVRWPLPFPVRDFLVRDGELRSWVAEVDGDVVGHVAAGRPGDDAFGRGFRASTGRDDVLEVAVLFTGLSARGSGVGGLLLDTSVAWIRAQGGGPPVLDVFPTHSAAVDVYRHRGWVEIGRVRPDWLPPWMPGGLPDVLLMTLPDRAGPVRPG